MNRLPFYSPNLERSAVEPSSPSVPELIDVLIDEQVQGLLSSGDLTVAIIRPNVGPDANLEGLSDIDAAEAIEAQIMELGVLAKFSMTFDEQGIDEFYEGPAKTHSMMPAKPLRDQSFPNRWEEFKHTMTNGPVTILLLHSEKGDAIDIWRSHLGHWNIEKTRDPSTIRGRMGVDNLNNLVHGSDSPESATREVRIITDQLRRMSGA